MVRAGLGEVAGVLLAREGIKVAADASTACEISAELRFFVPLNSMCSMKCEMPQIGSGHGRPPPTPPNASDDRHCSAWVGAADAMNPNRSQASRISSSTAVQGKEGTQSAGFRRLSKASAATYMPSRAREHLLLRQGQRGPSRSCSTSRDMYLNALLVPATSRRNAE